MGAREHSKNRPVAKKAGGAYEENNPQDIQSPDNKRKKQEDWNYLKQTLKSNNMMNNGGAGENGAGD